jgi:hypothetical protein
VLLPPLRRTTPAIEWTGGAQRRLPLFFGSQGCGRSVRPCELDAAGSPDKLQEMTIDPPIGGFPLIGWWVPKALEGKNGFPADG